MLNAGPRKVRSSNTRTNVRPRSFAASGMTRVECASQTRRFFAIEAEIILCRVKPHHPKDGLGYFLFERDEMLKLRAWDELERRRPVKERVFATIAAWGRLTERELERLYPEVDGYRIFCALGALEYEQRIRSCDHGYLVSHS